MGYDAGHRHRQGFVHVDRRITILQQRRASGIPNETDKLFLYKSIILKCIA